MVKVKVEKHVKQQKHRPQPTGHGRVEEKVTVVVVDRPAIEGHDFDVNWRQLKNHEKFPKDHVYFHEKVENMRNM